MYEESHDHLLIATRAKAVWPAQGAEGSDGFGVAHRRGSEGEGGRSPLLSKPGDGGNRAGQFCLTATSSSSTGPFESRSTISWSPSSKL